MPAPHHSVFFTGWMPNQQRQSTEGTGVVSIVHIPELCDFVSGIPVSTGLKHKFRIRHIPTVEWLFGIASLVCCQHLTFNNNHIKNLWHMHLH